MIVNKSKYCNGCHERVAEKPFILWHTVKDYVTIRRDEASTYTNWEDTPTPVMLHYCTDCWKSITKELPFDSGVLPF